MGLDSSQRELNPGKESTDMSRNFVSILNAGVALHHHVVDTRTTSVSLSSRVQSPILAILPSVSTRSIRVRTRFLTL
jgi:hypothetical protein